MNWRDGTFWLVVGCGLCAGIFGVLLAVWGNPENSGICVSCFLENSAGALGLHGNPRMQYLRPELVGFVLGALASATGFREFRSRGGSAPPVRLLAGVFLIVGCAVFIGCPIKLLLRLSAGDLLAAAGLFGLVAGVWVGLQGLSRGVHLGAARAEAFGSGWLVPGFFVLLLVFVLLPPGFLLASERGSAAQHAPWLVALAVGLLLGALAQRSRFCITGGIRDGLLFRQRAPLFWGVVAFAVGALAVSLPSGRFHPGLYGQPGTHQDWLWSFLGMALVGWVSVLVGGCPFRQLIKAGEGDADAGLVVIGMLLGAALVQSWGLAASAAGVPLAGKVAVLTGFLLLAAASLVCRERST